MYYWEALEWFSSISKWLHTWWAIVCVCVCVCSLAQLPGLADWLPLWLCLCWSNVRAQLTIIDVSFNEILYRHFVWCARAVVLPRQDCDDGKQTLVCWIGWCWLLPLKCTNVKEFGMFVLRLIARASVSVEFHFILQCLNTHIFMAKKSFRVVYIYAQCIVYTENSCMLSTTPHTRFSSQLRQSWAVKTLAPLNAHTLYATII